VLSNFVLNTDFLRIQSSPSTAVI